ncbi:hypothetical protein V6Z11_D02G038300 [Gossypium hirsutum]
MCWSIFLIWAIISDKSNNSLKLDDLVVLHEGTSYESPRGLSKRLDISLSRSYDSKRGSYEYRFSPHPSSSLHWFVETLFSQLDSWLSYNLSHILPLYHLYFSSSNISMIRFNSQQGN